MGWLISGIFSKGCSFYERPYSLRLVIEPVLFINLNICGRFSGKIGEFGRNRPERTLGLMLLLLPLPLLLVLLK
jgi:hypothetical protein